LAGGAIVVDFGEYIAEDAPPGRGHGGGQSSGRLYDLTAMMLMTWVVTNKAVTSGSSGKRLIVLPCACSITNAPSFYL
jgi:hypothetical protein